LVSGEAVIFERGLNFDVDNGVSTWGWGKTQRLCLMVDGFCFIVEVRAISVRYRRRPFNLTNSGNTDDREKYRNKVWSLFDILKALIYVEHFRVFEMTFILKESKSYSDMGDQI
jgi:hypothetical protein